MKRRQIKPEQLGPSGKPCRRTHPTALITVDPVQLLQPLLHRLLQVVAGPPERGVAAGDELVLLALQRTCLALSSSLR